MSFVRHSVFCAECAWHMFHMQARIVAFQVYCFALPNISIRNTYQLSPFHSPADLKLLFFVLLLSINFYFRFQKSVRPSLLSADSIVVSIK